MPEAEAASFFGCEANPLAWPGQWLGSAWLLAVATLWDGLVFGTLSPFIPFWVLLYGKAIIYAEIMKSSRQTEFKHS